MAEIGLSLAGASNQTATDGSDPKTAYLVMAAFRILVLVPLAPYMHRITHHIPMFFMCVFIATLIYNLVAFPFSSNNKYKAFWQQTVHLDTGSSSVRFVGYEEYVRPIITELPSAARQDPVCEKSSVRPNLWDCAYDGTHVPPNVADNVVGGVPPQKGYADLVSIKITPGSDPGQAVLEVNGQNTKSFVLKFKKPIKKFSVAGGTDFDDRFGRVSEDGVTTIHLWRRDWAKAWEVSIEWDPEASAVGGDVASAGVETTTTFAIDKLKVRAATGMEGNVTCNWSDINTPGTIPALDEALRFAPTWATITKLAPGLVEGSKSFQI